jgi:glycosyltransferase involved in cell wall biosynthesis/tetratricopeptide (TPR) repeat protein
MNDVTIGVAVIADDCLEQLQQLLPQLSAFDQVVIGWNGKDVKVKNYLTKLANKKDSPYEWFQFDWRSSWNRNPWTYDENNLTLDGDERHYGINDWGFSYARNLALQKLKTTHGVWLDTDDKIGFVKDRRDVIVSPEHAYRAFKKIAAEAPDDIDVWFFSYIYSRDRDNNPNVTHSRERMIKDPTKWTWVYPIHEVLVPPFKPKHAVVSDVQVIHYPPKKEEASTERNIRMLQEWYEQLTVLDGSQHDKGRCLLYIGETYWAMGKYKESAQHLTYFIREHPSSLDIEKWQAWCFIAKCQIELNNFEAARAAAMAAIDTEPGLCDGYILLAQVKLLTEQDPQDILVLIDLAGHVDEPPSQVITNPLDYTYTPYCIVSRCKYLLGQYDSALEWAIKARQVAPSDARSEQLRADAAVKIRERDSVNAAKALYQLYLDFDENEKASKLYEVLPYPAQHDEEIIEAANLAHRRVRHIFDREAYVSLYQENTHWEPVPEEFIDSGAVPGEARLAYILGRLKKALPNGGRILDVGCADGFHSMCYAKHGFEVVGVDLDPRCVDIANKRARERGLSAIFIHGFFEEMNPEKVLDPFDVQRAAASKEVAPDFGAPPIGNWHRHFDAVVCSEVVEHVQNPQFLMGCLVDCAKDGAPVIITTPDEAFDKGDIPMSGGMYEESKELAGHVRVYTQQTFEALLKSDPEINVVESHFVPHAFAYRENQGWQVGEVRRESHAEGPVVRIYCGPVVQFSPDSLEDKNKAIAGSEIAAVQVAQNLAKLGCQVVVYSGVNGVYDGVFYRTADHYSPDHYSDIFISWRLPTVFEMARPNAAKTILWTHDLLYQIQLPGQPKYHIPQEWADRIDTVVALSNFHKDVLERVHPTFKGKIWVSRNGIDPSRYLDRKIEKVPHRYFYSSDWQRGIEQLVEMWPQIREAIPDAELHVAYSYDLIQSLYKLTGEADKLRKIEGIYAKLNSLPGCVYHDRLGQQELADLQLSCEAWLYPPDPNNPDGGFLETYCITAVEAQAARCIPISRFNGALPETLNENVVWNRSTDIVEVLKDPGSQVGVSGIPMDLCLDENQKWALSQTWESLAVDWLKHFAPVEATT